MKLPKAVLKKMIELGYIMPTSSCPVEDMNKFGYYNIQEGETGEDEAPLFQVKSVDGSTRLVHVPLHPDFDKYVFGTSDFSEYLQLVGGADRMEVLRQVEQLEAPMDALWPEGR